MATFYHDKFASASWQGNYDVYDVGPGEDTKWVRLSMEAGASDLALNNVFKFIKLSSNTVVLGGQINTDTLDAHATPTLVLDVGYNLDSGTDDPDFFVNGSAGAAANVGFIAGLGAASPAFIPTDDYFVEVLVQTAAATGAAGTITLSLLLGNAGAYAG